MEGRQERRAKAYSHEALWVLEAMVISTIRSNLRIEIGK